MAKSHPEMFELRAKLPRGYEDYWSLIRAADAARGAFTTGDISGETNGQRQSVEHYVAGLVAGGFAELVTRSAKWPFGAVYRLLKRPKLAPRVRPDGRVIGPTAQERMWCAMRSLQQFTTDEIAFAATMPGQKVPRKTAQRYINQLMGAGYLTARGEPQRPQAYRLKPGPEWNTGPKSPAILVTETVWDRNLGRHMGPDPVQAEVAS